MGLVFSSAPISRGDLAGRHRGVHNFTWGTLQTYFRLTGVPREKILWDGHVLSVTGLPGGNTKTWVFQPEVEAHQLEALQRQGPVYSIDRIPLPKESKFHEIAYDLEQVFDPESYEGTRKRYQRLKYPFSWLRTHGVTIRDLTRRDLKEVERINEDWGQWKLSQPTTFQMMFPRRRYYACADYATDVKYAKNYVALGAEQEGRLVAVRVVYVEGEDAFDLANFGLYHRMPSHFSEYVATATMRNLLDRGIKTLNCGDTLNKRLSHFKEHWPSRPVMSWAYGRIKD